MGSWMRWAYMRKKKADGEFQLFSDNKSRIRHLTGIIQFISALTGLNLYLGIYNLYLYFLWGTVVNLLGLINMAISAVSAYGIMKLWRKRKILKEEQRVFE